MSGLFSPIVLCTAYLSWRHGISTKSGTCTKMMLQDYDNTETVLNTHAWYIQILNFHVRSWFREILNLIRSNGKLVWVVWGWNAFVWRGNLYWSVWDGRQSHRPLLGVEALRCQGLAFSTSDLAPFPDDLLHDLAGNAFSATTVMNPLAALFLLFAHTRQNDSVVAQNVFAMDVDLDVPFKPFDQ